jgi:hypothetical protein
MANKVKIAMVILLCAVMIIFLYIAFSLFTSYSAGLVEFKSDAISIFGSIIQGMAGLLSVAIAVIVFRIQSLENRNFSLEQSTLNYIYNIIKWTYPKWGSAVEEHIKSQFITERYYNLMRKNRFQKSTLPISEDEEKRLVAEKENQQKRLEEVLSEHNKINQTIKRTRDGIISSVILLIAPIIISFLMLMASDALTPLGNFAFVVMSILLSASGIVVLIKTVLDSTVQDD